MVHFLLGPIVLVCAGLGAWLQQGCDAKREGKRRMKGLPRTFRDFVKKHGAIWEAHEQLAKACAEAGPLDRKTRELIKVGISVAAGLQTATKRHAIMAVENGACEEEVYQAVLMAMTTCGHPTAMAGWQWAQGALQKPSKAGKKKK